MIESNHSACTSILIGKNATTDGSIIIGRNEDDKPNCAKHLAFHEEKDIPNNHFKSNLNKFEMDLPTHRYAYSSTPNWSVDVHPVDDLQFGPDYSMEGEA